MRTERNSGRKPLSYGVGALVALTFSIGLVVIVYGGRFLPLDPFNLLAWVFGPLGIYTIVCSLVSGVDSFYYLVWGSVMSAVGVASALYNVMNVFVVFGALVIVIVVIGLLAYKREK
jgi:hypothetical protein